jgi:hypothetical protein
MDEKNLRMLAKVLIGVFKAFQEENSISEDEKINIDKLIGRLRNDPIGTATSVIQWADEKHKANLGV